MPPKKPKLRDDELFRMQLTNMIDMDHPLVKVAQLIDWSQFDEGFGRFYTQKGRPGLPTRLLAGLHLLKHMEGLSEAPRIFRRQFSLGYAAISRFSRAA